MSSGALRQLFASFDVSTGAAVSKLQGLSSQVDGVKEGLVGIGGALLGAFSLHGVASFFEDMIELGSVVNDTSEKLGVSTDELQRFQFAAGLSGVNAEEAGRALGFLNKGIGEAIGGNKESAETFAKLGIAYRDGAGDVRELGDIIPEVADAFAQMGSDQERTAVAMKLFGKSGASLLPLLKQGSKELGRLNVQFTDLGLGLDEDFIKKADDAGDSIDIVKMGARALGSTIAAQFLPSITGAAKKISEWLATSRKLAKETNAVKIGMGALGVGAAVAAGKTLSSWNKVLGIFPKGASLFENLFKAGSLGITIGFLVFLGLAIEDIITMCKGGKSVIGDFLTEMFGAEYVTNLVNQLNTAWAQMQPSLDALKPLVADIAAAFVKFLPYAIAGVTDLVRFVVGAGTAVGALGKALADLWKGKKSAADIGDEFFQATNGLFGKNGLMNHSTLMDVIHGPATIPASAAGVYGPPPPPTNVAAQTTINVNGAGDPSAVAQRVAAAQEDALSRAVRNGAGAVARGPE